MPYRNLPAIEQATAELIAAARDAHTILRGWREVDGRFLDYYKVKERLGVALRAYDELCEATTDAEP